MLRFLNHRGLFHANQIQSRPSARQVFGFSTLSWESLQKGYNLELPTEDPAVLIAIDKTIETLDLADFGSEENWPLNLEVYKTPPPRKMFRTQGSV